MDDLKEKSFQNRLIKLIQSAVKNDIDGRTVLSSYEKPDGKYNELIFFIKPEVTIAGLKAVKEVLELSLESFRKYNIRISGSFIIGSRYLKEHNIIENHYGVINRAAWSGLNYLTDSLREKFYMHFRVRVESAHILGGFEFLDKFPEYSVSDLNKLWESGERIKLGAGIYCEKHFIDGKPVYIINGFNPYQIDFFTNPGNYIIVFSLYTDTDWPVLRNSMAGVTNPYAAEEGSIRQQILRIRDDIGVDINPGQNGVHLSAGPLEALAEAIRFCSGLPDDRLEIADVYTGQMLLSMGFTESGIRRCLDNVQVQADGDYRYIFDITEKKNLADLGFLKSLL